MRKIILITLVTMLLYSCGEFLKPNSKNQYIPENIESLAEVLVGDVYPSPIENHNLFSFNNILSDDISTLNNSDATIADIDLIRTLQGKKIYCLHPEMFNPYIDDVGVGEIITWEMHYDKIKCCNAILDYIETVKSDNLDLKNRVYAESYLFRAFYYFNLVNLFAEPYSHNPNAFGVPLKLASDFNPNFMARNSVKEVYSQIVKDLDFAEEYYSKFDNKEYFSSIMRPSVYLLYLLRSRVALYMEDWEMAKKYSEKVIYSNSKFELYDLNRIGSSAPTDEYPYPSYTSIDNVNSETIFVYGNISCISHLSNLLAVIPKETGINKTSSPLSLSFFIASPDLIHSFRDGDLRKKYYIALEYCRNNQMKGPIEGYYRAFGKVTMDYHWPRKDEFGLSFRLSEAYLNYAEACAKLNNSSEAISKMTELLAKKYTTGSPNAVVPSLTGDALVEFILTERRKELCFEGHRWFDQRRSGMKAYERLWHEQGKLVHKIMIDNNDAAFTFKLPNKIIENNLNLVQNRDWVKKY